MSGDGIGPLWRPQLTRGIQAEVDGGNDHWKLGKPVHMMKEQPTIWVFVRSNYRYQDLKSNRLFHGIANCKNVCPKIVDTVPLNKIMYACN